jgi:predicted ArsR family transcriptional regulator
MALDADVERFVAQHIHSVEQLEVLLLLQRSGDREWSAADVSRELSSHPHSVESRLLDLRARGLVSAREDGPSLFYRYAPPAELAPVIARLQEVYAERRVSVITMIFAKPIDSLRTLADAFRLRGPERKP